MTYTEYKTLKKWSFSNPGLYIGPRAGYEISKWKITYMCYLKLKKIQPLNQKHTFEILKLQYDIWLRQYPFYFLSHNRHTLIGENSITMPPQPRQINFLHRAPCLWMPHCLECFSCPNALLIINQLENVTTLRKKSRLQKVLYHYYKKKDKCFKNTWHNLQAYEF